MFCPTWPIMALLKSLKILPCSGLVKKSANIFSVGQKTTFNFPLLILSWTKKYLMSICREFPAQEFRPFVSIFIALWLSWYITFFLISYPWCFKNLSSMYDKECNHSPLLTPLQLNFWCLIFVWRIFHAVFQFQKT